MKRIVLTFIGLALLLSLSACGGGGAVITAFGTKQMGAGMQTLGIAVATDSSDNIYIAGRTEGGLDGNTLTGDRDTFITEYTSTGNKVVTHQFGAAMATGDTSGYAVSSDNNDNVYVTGYTSGGLNGNSLTGLTDLFLVKYGSAGNKLYTRQMGVTGKNSYGKAVATDANGSVYVGGYTNGGLDGNTVTGTRDLFLTEYDSAGNKLYTKQMGVSGAATEALSVATDANGNVYVTGDTTGALDGNSLAGTADLFLVKYDSAGNKLYTKQMGVSGADTEAISVATDSSGNIYVTGYTTGGLDGNSLAGTSDLFLVKYNSAGNKLYTKQLGVSGADTGALSVATDSSGSVYVAGYTTGALDGNSLTGTYDFVLIKYDSVGNKVYTKQMGVTGVSTVAWGVATDSSNNVYVGGTTYGGLDGNSNLTGAANFFLIKYNSAGIKQ